MLNAVMYLIAPGMQGCIIFTAFREYILLHPPWDWVLVTAAMYGHGAVVLLHFSGALRSQLTYSVTMACLLLCCAAACIAVGIPSSIIPAPLVSAVGLGLYYRTHSMREYAIFLLGACIAGLWFVGHHFWFLDISWDGHWDVRTTCMLLMIYIAPTILLPGLLISRILPLLSGGTLVLHAAMLSFAEIVLFSGNNDTAGNMYPGYAIIGTSMVGILMAVHLVESQRIPRWSSLAAQLLYAAKIMVLVLPQPLQALHAVLLASAAFAPVVLHPSKPGALRQTRMLPSVAIAHFGSIIFLTWECRHTIFSSLGELLGNPPGEGLALGALLVVLALTLYPLAGLLSTTAVSARQGIILLLATGMLLMALRPPLPQSAACHPHHHHHKHARWMCLQLFNRSDGVAREVRIPWKVFCIHRAVWFVPLG